VQGYQAYMSDRDRDRQLGTLFALIPVSGVENLNKQLIGIEV